MARCRFGDNLILQARSMSGAHSSDLQSSTFANVNAKGCQLLTRAMAEAMQFQPIPEETSHRHREKMASSGLTKKKRTAAPTAPAASGVKLPSANSSCDVYRAFRRSNHVRHGPH